MNAKLWNWTFVNHYLLYNNLTTKYTLVCAIGLESNEILASPNEIPQWGKNIFYLNFKVYLGFRYIQKNIQSIWGLRQLPLFALSTHKTCQLVFCPFLKDSLEQSIRRFSAISSSCIIISQDPSIDILSIPEGSIERNPFYGRTLDQYLIFAPFSYSHAYSVIQHLNHSRISLEIGRL